MLETCAQLAAGLGATAKKDDTQAASGSSPSKGDRGSSVVSVGNAPLGSWVGQRFLGKSSLCSLSWSCPNIHFVDIYRQEGDDAKARRQEAINARLQAAVDDLTARRKTILDTPPPQ